MIAGAMHLICNWGRRQTTAGKCFSFVRSLVNDANQSAGGSFHRLVFAPAFLSVPVSHAHNKAWSKQHGAQRNRASGA